MDSHPHILRVPGIPAAMTGSQSDARQTSPVFDDYVLREALTFPLAISTTPGDRAAVVSKLKTLASKYAHFHRSIAPCALASCHVVVSHPKAAALSRAADQSRSPSENVKYAYGTERSKSGGSSKSAAAAGASTAASCAPPDLESFWLATSPLPPTAVLTALYSLLPLRDVSVIHGDAREHSRAGETGADSEFDETAQHQHVPHSLETLWTLCRSTESMVGNGGQRQVSYWEAFRMTAMAVHRAAGRTACDGTTGPSPGSLFAASSFSLSHHLHRATALLDAAQQQHRATTAAPAAPAVHTATSLLEWPEELLWSLLTSLLAALALVHSAGLHFSGQLTASDVLCFSCTSSVPRLLQQTWQDIAAADVSQGTEADGADSVALFRRFYSVVCPSVLLPQAPLTPETPCHNAFFVVQPSLALLSRQQTNDGAGAAHAAKDEGDEESVGASVAVTSAAQDAADDTPAQQARFQAADVASVGRLLTTVMELRAQWSSEDGQHFSSTVAAAHPSSELVFLVRRLCECQAAATSNPLRSCPTALQLLQLQALRLRTETWYYRRLAVEAYDRLSHPQLAQHASQRTGSSVVAAQATGAGHKLAVREAEEAEEQLRAREAAVVEREAKLELILRVYELTYEHLDAVKLRTSQTPTNQSESSRRVDQQDEAILQRSQTPRDDSMEASLSAPTYPRAVAAAAATLQAAAALPRGLQAPVTNVSHQQHRKAVLNTTTESSGDALFGLSPLVRMSSAEDAADATLLSASAAPFTPFREADQRVSLNETHPLLWGVPMTPRALQMGEPARTFAGIAHTAETAPAAATPWSAAAVQQTTQIDVVNYADAARGEGGMFREPARWTPSLPPSEQLYTPWSTSRAPTQQQQHQSYYPPESQMDLNDHAQASATSNVTVVEVELDDSSDSEDAVMTQPNALSSDAARLPFTRRVAHDAQLTTSPHPTSSAPPPPPPQPPFSFPASASSALRFAQELTTPIRAPTLPNMGIADVDVSGVSAGGGGGGGGPTKYTPLSQLRSPPSARQPAAGRRATSLQSASPHSSHGYRSSTTPYTAVAPVYATAATDALNSIEQERPQRRSSRRSSSGGGGPHLEHRLRSTSANSGDGAAAAVVGTGSENGEWARQQLTELQNMQTALRSQQPATPRSRASAAAGAELRTPEPRHAQSPAASYSPPLRPAQGAVSPPPPSPSMIMTTPERHPASTDRSPVGVDSSGRARSSQHHSWHRQQRDAPHDDTSNSHHKGAAPREERPMQVQGTSWSAASAMRTPLSSRQGRHEDAWTTSAAHRRTPVLSGRATPPAKPSHLGLKQSPMGRAAADSSRGSSFSPAAATTTGAYTSTTASALGAALRTPLRQTAPATAVADAADYRRLANLFYPSYTHPSSTSTSLALGSARQNAGAASVAHSALAENQPGAGVNGRTAAPAAMSGAALPINTTTTAAAARTTVSTTAMPSCRVSVEVSPRRSNAGGGSSGPIRSARGHSSGAATASKGGAPLRRGGAAAHVRSSASASPSTGLASAFTSAAGIAAHGPRGGASSTSAMELLRRLRASSASTV